MCLGARCPSILAGKCAFSSEMEVHVAGRSSRLVGLCLVSWQICTLAWKNRLLPAASRDGLGRRDAHGFIAPLELDIVVLAAVGPPLHVWCFLTDYETLRPCKASLNKDAVGREFVCGSGLISLVTWSQSLKTHYTF